MSLQLSDLPLELFLLIFTYLHIRDLLKLDHLSRQLHGAISAYLATLKHLTLLPPSRSILDRLHAPTLEKLTDSAFMNLLERCPQLNEIASIPYFSHGGRFESFIFLSTRNSKCGLSLDGIKRAVSSHKTISRITVCSSAKLATTLFEHCKHISMKEFNVAGEGLPEMQSPIRLYPYTGLRVIQLESVFVESLPSLPAVEKMILKNVSLQSNGVLGAEFPSLKHFSFHGKFSSRGRTLADVLELQSFIPPSEVFLLSLSRSKALESLTISLDVFGIESVKKVAERGGFPSLKHLELIGSPLFIGTIGDARALESVAMLIQSCAASLEFLNLPSTVCFHSFYLYFSSKGIRLPRLQHLKVNAYSHWEITGDDSNRVGLNLFSDFLLRIPKIHTMSFIGYDGSLASLLLPTQLIEVTVPWRNRMNWQAQCDGICEVVDTCLSLKQLVITGLEVDALESLQLADLVRGSQKAVTLELHSEALEEFSISNSCIHSISLLGCKRKCSLHCCPVLKKLHLPAASIDQVSIYDQSGSSYIIEFLQNFSSQAHHSPHCYINIQLHDIRTIRQDDESHKRQDAEKALKMKKVTESLVSSIGSVIKRETKISSCQLTRIEDVTIHHSSTEQLFCCTEFHPDSYGRVMESVINSENLHRSCMTEAVQRWIQSLAKITHLAKQQERMSVAASKPMQCITSTIADSVSVSLFGKQYDCWTNIPCMFPLNSMLAHVPTAQGSPPIPLHIPHPTTFNTDTITVLCDSLVAPATEVDGLLGLHQPLLFITLSHYWHVVTILYDY